MTTVADPPKRRLDLAAAAGGDAATAVDERLQVASPLRRLLNKVFPDHWSFMLGEIALYSFIILLLTGTFLTLFFDPSMAEVKYNGSYAPLRGIEMSQAYESTLNISLRRARRPDHAPDAPLGGAAVHGRDRRAHVPDRSSPARSASRASSTGSSACCLFWLGFLEGFAGYSLPDDVLSGTGLRIACAIMLSIPVDRHLGLHLAVRWRVPRRRDPRPALHRCTCC